MGAGSSSGAVAIAFRLGYAIYDYGKRQYSILSIFWRRCACTRFNLRGLYSSFSIEAHVFVQLITLHAWFSVWIACFLRSCHVCAVISISTLTSYVVIDRRPKLAFSFLVLCKAFFSLHFRFPCFSFFFHFDCKNAFNTSTVHGVYVFTLFLC